RSIWIDPISPRLVTEIPFAANDADNPLMSPLPQAPDSAGEKESQDRALFTAAKKIAELKKAVQERDETILELKAGGVGTAPPVPIPQPEDLLEAFQERYLDARFQIRQLELEILSAEQRGAPEAELASI